MTCLGRDTKTEVWCGSSVVFVEDKVSRQKLLIFVEDIVGGRNSFGIFLLIALTKPCIVGILYLRELW